MLDTILTLIPFTQTSFESKKIYMNKDSILTALCLWTSLFRILYKECKHTCDSTWMWVALDLCCINKSPISLIPPWDPFCQANFGSIWNQSIESVHRYWYIGLLQPDRLIKIPQFLLWIQIFFIFGCLLGTGDGKKSCNSILGANGQAVNIAALHWECCWKCNTL